VPNAAGLTLKSTLTAPDVARQAEYAAHWLALDMKICDEIKGLAPSEPSVSALSRRAQSITAIITAKLPQGHWPNFIKDFLCFIILGTSVPPDPDVLCVHADKILTAIVHGVRKEEPSTDTQIATMEVPYPRT
ncbi:hypothetical protein BC834DRAFT_821217, partial [Gloeopeniophorella convolvens]